ncbi:guanine nucleotide exchange factor DBS-like [Corticium candelabrum]|uniref:guanine nucleotide exchange factor DBS-like n=1 Tax=Corticium candelabrum TaxID=121492 RepID=UPI002E26D235|nr:guanine nucleotide exchange factor DBS-like [Corticium candelabrum]
MNKTPETKSQSEKSSSSWLAESGNAPDIIPVVGSSTKAQSLISEYDKKDRMTDINTDSNREHAALKVKAVHLQKLLARQLVYLSGGMDGSHPILTFSASSREDTCQTSDSEITRLLIYFMELTGGKDDHLGFTVLVDMRDVNWSVVSAFVDRLQGMSCVSVYRAVVLRNSPWLDKFRLFIHKVTSSFKFTVVQSIKDLHRQIDPQELTLDYGGSLPYSHSEWIDMRKHIEHFIDGCDDINTLLSILTSNLVEVRKISTLLEAKDRLAKAKENLETVQSVAAKSASEGKALLYSMQHTEDISPLLATWTAAYVNATWSVQEQHEMLTLQSTAAQELLQNYMNDLEQCVMFQEFKEHTVAVINLLDEHFDKLTLADNVIGRGTAAAQASLQKHMALEIEVQNMIPKCQLVTDKASQYDSDHYAVENVQQMSKTVEKKLPEVTRMLAERTSLLEKVVEFSTLVDQITSWCNRGKDLLACQRIDQALTQSGVSKTLQQLETFTKSRVSLTRLQELAELIPFSAAQQQARHAMQKCGEVHEMVNNRKTQLNKICTTVRSLTPMETKRENDKDVAIRKCLSLELLSHDQEVKIFESLGRAFSDESREVDVDGGEIKTPDDGQVTSDGEDCEEESRQLVDNDDDETDGEILRKRVYVLDELVETERVYIEDLQQVIQGYFDEMDPSDPFLPPYLRGKRNIIFGNVKQIYQFHQSMFLSQLEQVLTPSDVAKCFLYNKNEFELYSAYCKNKVVADEFLQDCDQTFFLNCQKRLGHTLPLTAYLLKPVQRITKYQLLLKDMMNCCRGAQMASTKLQEALSSMLMVLKHVNDAMHSIGIEGFRGSLIEQGSLLLQDSFRVWDGKDPVFRKEHQRQVFLYEKAVIFSKKRAKQKNANKTVYSFKNSVKVSELGLTETVEDQRCRFILSQYGETERMFTLQAETAVVKQGWVDQIRHLLSQQLMQIRDIMSGQAGFSSSAAIMTPDFHDHSPLRERCPSKHGNGRPAAIHRQWSQRSLSCPLVPDMDTKRPTGQEPSIVITNSDNEGNTVENKDHVVRDLGAETVSTNSSNASALSTDSFDSGDEWGDSDDVLDMDLAPDQPRTYSVIANFNYKNLDDREITYLSLKRGDRVYVVKLGQGGWWFARVIEEDTQQPSHNIMGWVPASFLQVENNTITIQKSNEHDGDGESTHKKTPPEEPHETSV